MITKPKTKKVTLASKINEHAKTLYGGMMHSLIVDITSQPTNKMYSEQEVKEKLLRRARLAVAAAEAFHTNWSAVRGKYKEPTE